MQDRMSADRRRKRGRLGPLLLYGFVFILAAASVIYWFGIRDTSSKERIVPEYRVQPSPIMWHGEWTSSYALGQGEGMRIPLSVAQKLIGDGLRYEQASESIILTTDNDVLHFRTGELKGTLNSKPFSLAFAAEKSGDEIYLPLAPLTKLFGLRAEIGEPSGIVTLMMPGDKVQGAEVPATAKKAIKLRSGPNKKFAIVEDVPAGTKVRLWSEQEGWYAAQSASGQLGYVAKRDVALSGIETVSDASDIEEPFVAWKSDGRKINLTWEAVYSANPDTSKIGDLQGVNVVSPTWFELLNGKGEIRSKADAGYSAWARSNGVQVWGLFSNGFEPIRTHEALSSYETRLAMIEQIIAYAQSFKLQGINIDFENVYTKDKDNLVQFVREMTPLLHEHNLVVSIDVTPISSTEMWSLFLDRARLGETVDFMMVMSYDEHWATSPTSGSVSSLPWAENTIERIIEEAGVPSRKIIMGSPLYARLWTEEPDGKGNTKVSSKALGMDAVQQIIKDNKLKPRLDEETGQNYVEYKEGEALKRIWIEDATSIRARAEIAKKYNLAGIATWRRGFETPDIWGALDESLQSRP
ncbi:glycosyl hydrolase family 18 protein [Cohnella yongneupensis]|uniref:Glycosyl hydrolase family 18 protein n=1 Tax=Cohnella yongneupensis TaxID=425006 RepID=A0ABW0R0Q9_9BACL